jgi:hypothetical protein
MNFFLHLLHHAGMHLAKELAEKMEHEQKQQKYLAEQKKYQTEHQKYSAQNKFWEEEISKTEVAKAEKELKHLIENDIQIPYSYLKKYPDSVIRLCIELKKPDTLMDLLLKDKKENEV